jgi:hypothetical protein
MFDWTGRASDGSKGRCSTQEGRLGGTKRVGVKEVYLRVVWVMIAVWYMQMESRRDLAGFWECMPRRMWYRIAMSFRFPSRQQRSCEDNGLALRIG